MLFALYNKNNDITKFPEKIEKELQNSVIKNVKAMFLHKIGDVIFSTVDSLVISSIIGVVVLGYYSNYVTIVTSMNELLKMFIIPLTSVIGHMGVKASKTEKKRYFGLFYSINFFLGFMFYLGYYAVSNDVVTIIFGDGLLIENNLLLVLTITYYIQFLRQSASVFKDSFGLFYKDRWIALMAALLNAGLSILMAYFWGVYGVLIATIIVDIFIYHIFEPLILYKYGFECKPLKYYVVNYIFMAIFSATIICFSKIDISLNNHFVHLLVMGTISLLFDFIPLTIILFYKPFRVYAFSKLKRLLKKKK
jgi:O-antigen/teichoic acid export membrane protein